MALLLACWPVVRRDNTSLSVSSPDETRQRGEVRLAEPTTPAKVEAHAALGRLARDKGLGPAIARYGSQRSFALRTLYSWLTLTTLLTFSWPLLVVYAGAPTGVSPRSTPLAWFVARLLVAALGAAGAGLLWRLSPIPSTFADPERARRLFRREIGRFWPQLLVFLSGLSILLLLLLLITDPLGALQVALLGLAEALALQVLLCGYLKGFFDLTLDDYRATVATLGLFALTYGMREALDAASGSGDFVVALAAGALLGVLLGSVSLWLRAKSGSLLPAVLLQWLLLYILVGLFES